MPRWCMIILCLGLYITPVLAQNSNQGLARNVLNFPQDHGFHASDPLMNANYVEWVYFTGITQDDAGHQWGFQFTIFSRFIPNTPLVGYLYDVAVSDLRTQQFLHHREVVTKSDALAVSETGWQFQDEHLLVAYRSENDSWKLNFQGEANDVATRTVIPLTLNFSATNDQYDYYVHNTKGLHPMGNDCVGDGSLLDGYTYYYSHPALSTIGSIKLDDTTTQVSGATWLDHQWGNFSACPLAWNWFSLRFNDGSYIMLFQLLDEMGTPLPALLGATYVDSTGQVTYWPTEGTVTLTPTHTWTNPRTHVEFTLGWQLETPMGKFSVEAVFDDQTPDQMNGLPYYWEGVITIRPSESDETAVGTGYLEVVPANVN
ncbi:MAG: hypothetical protein HY862_18090 [Chloroflexi bacterium]|nr:hypothetical protein [Chloroflexota bacterium]